ncbi:Alpha/Beta hydrolase protein [Astrocystis sublimbata]|nr:Alpha/Beta hydrolase protein [Astrocystis sublimbata]
MRQLSRQLFNKLKAVAAADVGELIFPDNCEGPDTGFDLFFVHGLRGSRTNTWSCDGVFWPHDFLKDDLENIRVITWGYDANIANPSGPASAESLYGHASTLLGDLARIRRNINRPIIFICHSLGGLVVKQALITASSYQAYGGHPSLGKIYNDTSGVIFMGTPHRGSATVAYGEVLVKIAKLTSRQPNEQLLRTLRIDSHILEQQRDGFIIISQKMDIVCINEELPMKIGLVNQSPFSSPPSTRCVHLLNVLAIRLFRSHRRRSMVSTSSGLQSPRTIAIWSSLLPRMRSVTG